MTQDSSPTIWYSVVNGTNHCHFASTSREEAERFVVEELIPDADVTIVEDTSPYIG